MSDCNTNPRANNPHLTSQPQLVVSVGEVCVKELQMVDSCAEGPPWWEKSSARNSSPPHQTHSDTDNTLDKDNRLDKDSRLDYDKR